MQDDGLRFGPGQHLLGDETAERAAAFRGWIVTEKMLRRAKPEAIVLHCLPAHRGEEVDGEGLDGPRSRVWGQAENRLHVQKALLLWLLGTAGPGATASPY